MERRYETRFKNELALESVNGTDQRERVQNAQKDFKPMYYIINQRADGKEPQKLDMSFDCTLCQFFTVLDFWNLDTNGSRSSAVTEGPTVGKTRIPDYLS